MVHIAYALFPNNNEKCRQHKNTFKYVETERKFLLAALSEKKNNLEASQPQKDTTHPNTCAQTHSCIHTQVIVTVIILIINMYNAN